MLARKKKGFNKLLEPLINLLARCRVTPNQITLAGLVLGILGAVFARNYWLGFGLFIASFSLDSLDGALARKTKTATKFGAVFDSVCDKVVEMLFLYYIAVITGLYAMAVIATGLSIVISYVKHRGALEGVKNEHSIFDRAERFIYTIILVILNAFIPQWTYWLFAVYTSLCGAAVIQLFTQVKKQLY